MKKYFIALVMMCLLISGCRFSDDKPTIKENSITELTETNESKNIIQIVEAETNTTETDKNTSQNNETTEEEKPETEQDEQIEPEREQKLIMFHNGKGPMCLDQLEFLDDIKKECPSLIIEEYLTIEASNLNILYNMESQYENSEGVSDSFGFLPITFINNHAYSGFDRQVEKSLKKDIEEICS